MATTNPTPVADLVQHLQRTHFSKGGGPCVKCIVAARAIELLAGKNERQERELIELRAVKQRAEALRAEYEAVYQGALNDGWKRENLGTYTKPRDLCNRILYGNKTE